MSEIDTLNKEVMERIELLADSYCLLLKQKQKEEAVKMSEIIKFFSDLYKCADKNNKEELQSILNELIANEG